MNGQQIIGIDLGGTNARAGILQDHSLDDIRSVRINSAGAKEEVIGELFELIDSLISPKVNAIGIGVPSVVDAEKGIVYDVVNIPSWKEVYLKDILEGRYHRPVFVNNDANCFALGEKYFGEKDSARSMVGLIIGTGMAAGIIIDDCLHAGPNCGAGELGMIDYRDHNYEYYASGQYFENVHHLKGEEVFHKAQSGDQCALEIFNEFGVYLGNAIKTILYAFDPERVVLGGGVSQAYTYFQQTMWKRIHTFAYPNSLEDFRVEVSELDHSGVLGAAALYYDSQERVSH